MRGVLALLLVVGGGLLAYAVATGKFPAAPTSGSSAQTPTQLGNAAGNAVLLATGNGPSGASTAGKGLVPASGSSTGSSSVTSGGVGPILIGGKQVF